MNAYKGTITYVCSFMHIYGVCMYVEWLICKTHFWHIGTCATENLTDEVLEVEFLL